MLTDSEISEHKIVTKKVIGEIVYIQCLQFSDCSKQTKRNLSAKYYCSFQIGKHVLHIIIVFQIRCYQEIKIQRMFLRKHIAI